jgi:hypothetical protein
VFLCFSRLPEIGTPVPKQVGVDTYHELYFTIYMLLYIIERIVRRCTEYKKMHGMLYVKFVTNNAHGIIYELVTCEAVLAEPRHSRRQGPYLGPLRFFGVTLKKGPMTEVINKFCS